LKKQTAFDEGATGTTALAALALSQTQKKT